MMAAAKNTRQPPVGRRFTKGQSGNPRGRTRGSKNKPRHLSVPDAIAAGALAGRGLSTNVIAKLLDVKPEAVKAALSQARVLGEMCAPEVMMNWVRATGVAADQGDHKPAMALLQSIDVVKPVAQTYDTANGVSAKAAAAVQVQIVGFNCAGLPPPAIAVTASEGSEP